MKNITLAAFLFLFFCAKAQHKKTGSTPKLDSISISVPNYDSILQASTKKLDSINTASSIERMNDNSVKYFSELSRENDRKARQAMWLRIGLGIGFAVIGVVGLMRKKKVKKDENKV